MHDYCVATVIPLKCCQTYTYCLFQLNVLKIAYSEATLLHVPEDCTPPFIIFGLPDNTCTEHVHLCARLQGNTPSVKEIGSNFYHTFRWTAMLLLLYSMEICFRCTRPSYGLKGRNQLPSLCPMVLLYIISYNVLLCMQVQHHNNADATHWWMCMHQCIHNCTYTVQGE
jgi:hypothetical protein